MRKSAGIAALAAAGLMAAGVAAPSAAAPSNKGTTSIEASAITVSVLESVAKPGSLDGLVASFGIVGNPEKGVVKHVGGLNLNAVSGPLEIRNFWIAGDEVSAIVNDSFRAVLFDLEGAELTFTETASNAIVGNDAIEGKLAGTVVS